MLELSAAEIGAGVGSGHLAAVELIESCLAAITDRRELNAVITVCAEQALACACSRPSGRLAGVPLLVKDLLDTAGVRTTYGSPLRQARASADGAGGATARGRGRHRAASSWA